MASSLEAWATPEKACCSGPLYGCTKQPGLMGFKSSPHDTACMSSAQANFYHMQHAPHSLGFCLPQLTCLYGTRRLLHICVGVHRVTRCCHLYICLEAVLMVPFQHCFFKKRQMPGMDCNPMIVFSPALLNQIPPLFLL